MIRIAALFLAIVFATVAQAQQYKWVDKDGKTQYGDAPPPGVKGTSLKPPPGPTAPPAAAASKDGKKAPPTPEEAFRKRQEEQKSAAEKTARTEKEAADRKRNCDNARDTLRNLESGTRISRTNEKGERYFVDDEQRAKEMQQQRGTVTEACKS